MASTLKLANINGYSFAVTDVTLSNGQTALAPVFVAVQLDGESAADDTTPVPVKMAQDEYETVAASATDQPLGATGAAGDYLAGLMIVPATTSPGAVSIKDGAGSAITVFTGGASSVSNLASFYIPIGARCSGAGWKVTTGAAVSVLATGDFT